MRIAFYAPFKPLNHPNPSGDLMIGQGIFSFLEQQGHQLKIVSTLRSRWIFLKPLQLLRVLIERQRVQVSLRKEPVDLWLTYHCYYKAPDILGSAVCHRLNLPYVIIQPSYGTRVSRNWKTRPGFYLNRKALLAADMLITDRSRDLHNLQRIIPPEQISRIQPGINPQLFSFDEKSRQSLRKSWKTEGRVVILAAAMFRSDVKTRSLQHLLKACVQLHQDGSNFQLVIVGDGSEKESLQRMAEPLPQKNVLFTGQVAREYMYRYYSAADIFGFPGINESLGMVFLEAQSCGLPVVAYDNGGIGEVVVHNKTGLLTPLEDSTAYGQALAELINNPEKRKKMRRDAAAYIRSKHDININYQQLEDVLNTTLKQIRPKSTH